MKTAIDFNYLLLENYKKLNISESELATIFVIQHLLEDGNDLITADLLSLKMNLDVKEIDKILASLLKKNYLSFETNGKSTFTSLEPLKQTLLNQFEYNITKEKETKNNKEVAKLKNELCSLFESSYKKSLSPVEKSKINDWINFGYTKDQIINALKDSVNQNKKSMRSVDKILLTYQIREDIDKEGHSVLDDHWNKNLEETIKIAKTPWIDDDNK